MGKACYKCMRYSVMLFNFLFVLIGVGVLACAIFATVDEQTKNFLQLSGQDDYVTYALYGLMGIGGVTMLIGIFGCCGAYHESQCLLAIYFVLLIIICAAEAVAGVLGFMFKKQIMEKIDGEITKTMEKKKKNMSEKNYKETKMDQLQRFLRCCGAGDKGPREYDTVSLAYKYPESCCNRAKYTADDCKKEKMTYQKAYQSGCMKGYKKFVTSNFIIILCVIGGIAVIELLGIIFAIAACCIIRRRDTAYTTVEAHDDPYR